MLIGWLASLSSAMAAGAKVDMPSARQSAMTPLLRVWRQAVKGLRVVEVMVAPWHDGVAARAMMPSSGREEGGAARVMA